MYFQEGITGNAKYFTGNSDSTGRHIEYLDVPVNTSHVKIMPTVWASGIGLAMAVYGTDDLTTCKLFPCHMK